MSLALGALFCAFLVAAPARAAGTSCTPAAAGAAAPAGVTIGDIPNLNAALPKTTGGVALIPAGFFGTGSPEVCLITGTVLTNSATGKTANFGAVLPAAAAWNGKFLFEGCAGNCGTVTLSPTAVVLAKGYPVWSTDDGHVASNLAWPIASPGVPDQDAIEDFAYRAVHTVVADGKQFTLRYYGAHQYSHAYYEGCSDGGREGMVEANRYPDDFDGMLAGDPYFDVPGQNIIISNVTVQLQLKAAQITPALMTLASTAVTAQCDAADGVTDGLIQNPAVCRFNPQTDLPKCKNNVPAPTCFTDGQAKALWTILAAMTDPDGNVIHPGYPVSNLNDAPGLNLSLWAAILAPPQNLTGPQPWPNYVGADFDWTINDPGLRYWAYLGAPSYNSLTTPGFTYGAGGPGPVSVFHTTAPYATVNTIFGAMSIAAADYPQKLAPFIAHGHKLIMYHGYSDGFITPYRTIQYYATLAKLEGRSGYDRLQQNVRLFMVPGMYHCSGGPGPNNFGQSGVQPQIVDAQHDATTALEAWVERGQAPASLIATKFANDVPADGTLRTMPLCPFPARAHFRGGSVNDASRWMCYAHDTALLDIGFDGIQAGLEAPLY